MVDLPPKLVLCSHPPALGKHLPYKFADLFPPPKAYHCFPSPLHLFNSSLLSEVEQGLSIRECGVLASTIESCNDPFPHGTAAVLPSLRNARVAHLYQSRELPLAALTRIRVFLHICFSPSEAAMQASMLIRNTEVQNEVLQTDLWNST